ncbi:MAG: cobyrinate a,c-diamide synthase [Burkholderiales bacterium]|nr:cobyrinate a,c-diamide synthase [Burkholderiales bacterium]
MVAAIASGQGKTSVCAALARKLQEQGQRVTVFKTGADFIDPLILQHAAHQAVEVLDIWLLGEAACQQKLSAAAAQSDVVLIEGVMGLYDGNPSAADLARAFDIPVLLVIDASAMAQTVGALVYGMQHFGNVKIAGVIANKVASSGHAAFIASSLRECPLLGYLPPQKSCLPERHLGLVLPDEVGGLDHILQELADGLQLDREKWDSIATSVLPPQLTPTVPPLLQGKTIAVARDAAFAFIYPANIACLQALGAHIVYFSPLANQAIPFTADALYLPGGYPELHAATIAQAKRWQASLRAAQGAGMPIWAECGGMMALVEHLIDKTGRSYSMAGLLPGTVRMHSRLGALGPQAWQVEHGQLRGHTFHFSSYYTNLAPHAHAQQHPNGHEGEAIYRLAQLQASYFHAYFPSNPVATAALFGVPA